jgi:cytochrome c553
MPQSVVGLVAASSSVRESFKMKARTLAIMTIALLATASIGVPAQADPAAGKALVKQRCQTCHGVDGIARIPIAPHLAGESQIYLETQLKAFRSGKRENEIMSLIAKPLSDEEIANLAEWYSSIKITATIPE